MPPATPEAAPDAAPQAAPQVASQTAPPRRPLEIGIVVAFGVVLTTLAVRRFSSTE